jgi:tRNA1(Val) A37 N6-methylase TrmN6
MGIDQPKRFDSMEAYLAFIDARAPKHDTSIERTMDDIRLQLERGVWDPTSGKSSRMMLHAMELDDLSNVQSALDIGAGSGILGIKWRLQGVPHVVLADVDPIAVRAAQESAKLCGADVTCIQSDLFENVSGTYDRILFNAPATHPLRRNAPPGTQGILWSPEENILVRFLRCIHAFLNEHGSGLLMYSRFEDFDPLPEEVRRQFPHLSFEPVIESPGAKSLSQVLRITRTRQ